MTPPDDEVSARRAALTSGEAHPANMAEVILVRSGRVSCDGVGGALGHPRVWIELGGDGVGECPYCDRRFILAGDGSEDEALAPGVYEGPGGH